MQGDDERAIGAGNVAVPPGSDPGQLDATFPGDDLGTLLGEQHAEFGRTSSPGVRPVPARGMSRGLMRGVTLGGLAGLVLGAAVGVVLAIGSVGSLAAGWTVFIAAAVGVAVGATAGAVYEAPRSAEIADEREVARHLGGAHGA